MIVYDSKGNQIACETARYWKGEDAKYLILILNREHGLPPDIHERLSVVDGMALAERRFIVREIQHDMAKDQFTIQAIDEASFRRKTRFTPRPPRFDSVEEADAWLEKFGG